MVTSNQCLLQAPQLNRYWFLNACHKSINFIVRGRNIPSL
jgi:hypothetical protein